MPVEYPYWVRGDRSIGGMTLATSMPEDRRNEDLDFLPILGDRSLVIYRHDDGNPDEVLFVVDHKDAKKPILEIWRPRDMHILDVALEIRDHEAIIGYLQAYQSND